MHDEAMTRLYEDDEVFAAPAMLPPLRPGDLISINRESRSIAGR
jgi:hypothetical protein